jgi:NADH-quinone oxidoreductase subunit J
VIPEFILFWATAAVCVVGALGVVFAPNVVHAVLSLLVVLFGIAVGFFTLGSPMLAAMQIIIYAGAVVVMFLFVVMLLDITKVLPSLGGARGALAVLSVLGSVTLTFAVVAGVTSGGLPAQAAAPGGDAVSVGLGLYTDHVILLLLVAILLTAAADGVVGLTQRRESR